MVEALPDVPYFAFVSRANRRPATGVWPIALDAKLPTIPVPLLPGDRDVELDLQAALHDLYDPFNFDLVLDYSKPPEIPLQSDAWEWARKIIAARKPGRGNT
jgi:hypothetical protein